MAIKLRREKDIISRITSDYQTAATTEYAKYLSGSPVYVTYYQLFAPGSTTDNGLEAVHSVTNSNSPNVYKVIEDFPLYGLGNLDIDTMLTERGLESLINSSLIVAPQTIIPTSSDFISFNVEGMERELFEISNVAFDRVHANRYYQIEISLYKENVDEIFENCLDTVYVFDENDNNGTAIGTGASDGGIGGSIIPKDQQALSDSMKNLYDALLTQYQKLFYDVEMDQFVYRGYGENGKIINFWSPYLHKFFYETKLLQLYSEEVMTEFYVRDINSWDFGERVFNDYCWDTCIYKAVLTESELEAKNQFISISSKDLRQFKTLPFFWSQYEYKMVDFDLGPKSFWLDAFHISKDPILDNSETFIDMISNGKIESNKDQLSDGDFVLADESIPPQSIFIVRDLGGMKILSNVTDFSYGTTPIHRAVSTIFNGNFSLTENLVKELNKFTYKKSLELYLLLPILLYGIKGSIEGLAKN